MTRPGQSHSRIVTAGVLAGVLAVSAVLVFQSRFRSAVDPVTDPAQYQNVIAGLARPGLLAGGVTALSYFPPAIPANSSPQLYYQPHFLQGGMILQLKCVLGMGEVSALLKQLPGVAKQTTQGNVDALTTAQGPGGLLTADFEVGSATRLGGLPSDFIVFVIGARPGPPTNAQKWEDGFNYGVAVSRQRSEVIYFLNEF